MKSTSIPENSIQIESSWKSVLEDEFNKEYFLQLKSFLKDEKKRYLLFPPGPEIFAAFHHTPFDKVKVVIIGQDPYHGPGQANGLCFSVANGVPKPPSLQNIFKELEADLGIPIPANGDLTGWADQGVLLLNATLTVRSGQAGSHQNKGWEIFTDHVIRTLSEKKKGIIFLLWGKFAQTKQALIDNTKHFVLTAAHPSPLARGAFFGSKHFSKTNEILRNHGQTEINWDPTYKMNE